MCEYNIKTVTVTPEEEAWTEGYKKGHYNVKFGIGSQGGLYITHPNQHTEDYEWDVPEVALSPSVVRALKQVLAEHYPDEEPETIEVGPDTEPDTLRQLELLGFIALVG